MPSSPLPQSITDPELVSRCRARCPWALAEFYERMRKSFFRAFRDLNGSGYIPSLPDADREEILHDLCLALVAKLHTFRGEAKLTTWMYRCGRHAILDAQRRARRRGAILDLADPEGLDRLGIEFGAAASANDHVDARDILARVVRALTPDDRKLVECMLQGMSRAEMMAALSLTATALHGRIARVRERIRKLVQVLWPPPRHSDGDKGGKR